MSPRVIDTTRSFLVVAAIAALVALVLATRPSSAHAPHDDVNGIVFSPDFEESGTVMAIVRGRLMRSDDRGITWSEVVNGLGGEVQQLRDLAIAPADPSIAYASSKSGELLRSDDGGRSWVTLPAVDGVVASSILVAPDDPDTVFTFAPTAPVLARSADGGRSWNRPQLDGAEINVTDTATHPDGRIFVVNGGGRVSASDGVGDLWTSIGTVGSTEGVRQLAVASDAPATMFAATGGGALFRSEDGGASFSEVGTGLPEEPITEVTTSGTFDDDGTVWVVARDSGPYRSVDRGGTFERVFEGLTRSAQADDLELSHFRTTVVAPGSSGEVLLAGFDGLFMLPPDSDSWVPVETLAGYIAGLAVSPAYADDGTVVVMSYVRGAFVSRDGGADWELANEGLTVSAIGEGNRFAPLRRLHNVHFSPDFVNDQTLWGANWVRLIRSRDGGRSWEEIAVGEPPEGSPLRQFVVAPSPQYTQDRTVYAGTRQGEFFRSESEGDADSWELLTTFPNRVRSVAVSPEITGDGTIFVGTTAGVYRSTDGGVTWEETTVRNATDAQGAETDFGIQVAVSPAFAEDRLVVAATDDGLCRSFDAGATWEEVTTGVLEGDELIEAVSFSPAFAVDGLVLASVRGLGLVRSTDGGATFELTGGSLIEENLIIADFANPSSAPIQFSPTYATDRAIYAYAQQQLLRSTNAGADWEIVRLPSDTEVLASLPPFEPAADASRLAEDSTSVPGDSTSASPTEAPPDRDADDGNGIDTRLLLMGMATLVILALGTVVVRRSSG